MKFQRIVTAWFVAIAVCVCIHAQATDPLPSWNTGVVKQRIVAFVTNVTATSTRNFVPPA